MNEFETIFSRPWTVRIPAVTRYLKSDFVDSFYKDGTLRLSSFKAFREHADEARGDIFEGRGGGEISSPNSHSVYVCINGQEAYILSTSTIEDENLSTQFSANSGFRIIKTLEFADAISRQIPGFVAGMQGHCLYRNNLVVKKDVSTPFEPPPSDGNIEKWVENYDKGIGAHFIDNLFLKLNKYSYQNEYRFIWFAQGVESHHLDIKCPEAIKFCERLPIYDIPKSVSGEKI